MEAIRIGVIGGSGLYQMAGLQKTREIILKTPFGSPSDTFVIGEIEGKSVVFLARHGRGHSILPSDLNFRANIYGMKMLGVESIISASAVGSLKDEHKPLDIILPDQFFDRTRGRVSSFFGEGLVAHIGFSEPVCPSLGTKIVEASKPLSISIKRGGTYLCMEGPAFSTLAESNLYRSWNMDIIGMTNLQEAKLAREAEICYSTIALVTDYDCWHPDHEAVTVDQVIEVLNKNSENAQNLIRATIGTLPDDGPECKCRSALKSAILTDHSSIPKETLKKLQLLLGKYINSV